MNKRIAQIIPDDGDNPLFRSGDSNFMTSLARGLEVILAFSRARCSLSMADVARETGLSRAVVRRCLYTLEALGYVTSAGRAYRLQPKILTLGYAYLTSNPIAYSTQPILEKLSETVDESCSVAVLDGADVVYVARAPRRRIMSVSLDIGSHLPAYCTSLGRVLLAHLPDAERESLVSRLELKPMTEFTITDRHALRENLAEIRAQGYALIDQELELGLRSIAVPVVGLHGRVSAAINVGTQAARISKRQLTETILPHLREAAGQLSARLTI